MEKLLATKSSSYPTNLWDCGSTLYDSFELNSFQRQLHSAIANSPITRTLSMPHLPERSLHALPDHPPLPSTTIMSRKSFNFSRSFHKLIRSVFKSNNKSTTATTTTGLSFQVPEKYSKERFYVVYDKSGPVLSTIPEVPEFEIAALSPEISSFVRSEGWPQ
ncbi:unnamed protein product [Sphenostylis stenocarpa]|uniref:Uncharacterized protein n=1 Tax=Sphenostylis stenocarpa TaxID=92480 RepID=A0AA86RSQ7_9FABA|nr:unnamed protein product [Sphenostylis stenocarpa]